jgi:hypothetical protein
VQEARLAEPGAVRLDGRGSEPRGRSGGKG